MPEFAPRQTIETKEPVVSVEGLPVGVHTFRLVVVDDAGNTSTPADVRVEVYTPPRTLDTTLIRTGTVAQPLDPRLSTVIRRPLTP